MYQYQQIEKISNSSQDILEEQIFPVVLEMEKKNQFLHFLQKELSSAKTETEKEAIQSILLKTKIQIRALERELQGFHHLSRMLKPVQQYIYPTFRIRRLQ